MILLNFAIFEITGVEGDTTASIPVLPPILLFTEAKVILLPLYKLGTPVNPVGFVEAEDEIPLKL